MEASNRLKVWWPGTELNRRRQPFQGCALPPELPGHAAIQSFTGPRSASCLKHAGTIAELPLRSVKRWNLWNAPIIAIKLYSLNAETSAGGSFQFFRVSSGNRESTSIGCEPIWNFSIVRHVKDCEVSVLPWLYRSLSFLQSQGARAVDSRCRNGFRRRHLHLRAGQRHYKRHAGCGRRTWIVIRSQRHRHTGLN